MVTSCDTHGTAADSCWCHIPFHWTSPCQHEWLCVTMLGRQSGFSYHTHTPNTCIYTCLLRRCSPSSLDDWTSSPHSLYSIPLIFKLFVPCIFSTYGMKTNWCHYFIRILLDLYMFRAHRAIFRRVRTAVHTTIGSVSVPLCSRALYVVACLGDYALLACRDPAIYE